MIPKSRETKEKQVGVTRNSEHQKRGPQGVVAQSQKDHHLTSLATSEGCNKDSLRSF